MVQNTTTLSSVQDISWHNKGGVGTLSLQQLYNKKNTKQQQTRKQTEDTKQDSQTSIVKTLVTSIDPYISLAIVFHICHLLPRQNFVKE